MSPCPIGAQRLSRADCDTRKRVENAIAADLFDDAAGQHVINTSTKDHGKAVFNISRVLAAKQKNNVSREQIYNDLIAMKDASVTKSAGQSYLVSKGCELDLTDYVNTTLGGLDANKALPDPCPPGSSSGRITSSKPPQTQSNGAVYTPPGGSGGPVYGSVTFPKPNPQGINGSQINAPFNVQFNVGNVTSSSGSVTNSGNDNTVTGGNGGAININPYMPITYTPDMSTHIHNYAPTTYSLTDAYKTTDSSYHSTPTSHYFADNSYTNNESSEIMQQASVQDFVAAYDTYSIK